MMTASFQAYVHFARDRDIEAKIGKFECAKRFFNRLSPPTVMRVNPHACKCQDGAARQPAAIAP
jgi:hypothetical protein